MLYKMTSDFQIGSHFLGNVEVSKTSNLTSPYGGSLVDLRVSAEEVEEYRSLANSFPSLRLSDRTVCDLEMLSVGAFSPLDRFMGQDDYSRVTEEMRLENGLVFPIPITLPVEADANLHLDKKIALRDARNDLLGIMTVEEIYDWDYVAAVRNVFGTEDVRHPMVAEMLRWGKRNISGRLEILQLPRRFDFQDLRLTPEQTRSRLRQMGREKVVAFQTRNPIHRAHEELTKRAIEQLDGT